MSQKPIPIPDSDLSYNTITDIQRMPGQKFLTLGWSATNDGAYLVSNEPEIQTHKDVQYRVQHWRNKGIVNYIYDVLHEVNFAGLYYRYVNWFDRKQSVDYLVPTDIEPIVNSFLDAIAASRRAGYTYVGFMSLVRAKIESLEAESGIE